MKTNEVTTFYAHIYMAGDIVIAKHICQEFVARGLCVTLEPVDYIYTGGNEQGFRVGLINYPRFPTDESKIKSIAIELANLLREKLFQHSYSIVFPNVTIWDTLREN